MTAYMTLEINIYLWFAAVQNGLLHHRKDVDGYT